jgi:hypothetical protein
MVSWTVLDTFGLCLTYLSNLDPQLQTMQDKSNFFDIDHSSSACSNRWQGLADLLSCVAYSDLGTARPVDHYLQSDAVQGSTYVVLKDVDYLCSVHSIGRVLCSIHGNS